LQLEKYKLLSTFVVRIIGVSNKDERAMRRSAASAARASSGRGGASAVSDADTVTYTTLFERTVDLRKLFFLGVDLVGEKSAALTDL
jgi:hypothetical protein